MIAAKAILALGDLNVGNLNFFSLSPMMSGNIPSLLGFADLAAETFSLGFLNEGRIERFFVSLLFWLSPPAKDRRLVLLADKELLS